MTNYKLDRSVLLVMNSAYQSAGYPDLPGVTGDKSLWLQFFGEKQGWDGVVLDNPTLSEFKDVCKSQKFDLIIYSGHGVRRHRFGSRSTEGLAFVRGSKLEVLWDTDDRSWLLGEPLWFIDCCHAGGVLDTRMLVNSGPSACMKVSGERLISNVSDEQLFNLPEREDHDEDGYGHRSVGQTDWHLCATAMKHQVAIEVRDKKGASFGLGTMAFLKIVESATLESGSVFAELSALMRKTGGVRASTPCGLGWEGLYDLLTI